jgi:hypothetical protein
MTTAKEIFSAVWMMYGREKSLQFKNLLLRPKFRARYTVNSLITC